MKGSKKTLRIFWTLFAFNALFYVPGATFGAYIGVYYRSKGMNVSQIGLLSAIGPLLALILQPLWGILSDRRGRHMAVLRLALAGSAAAITGRTPSFFLPYACPSTVFSTVQSGPSGIPSWLIWPWKMACSFLPSGWAGLLPMRRQWFLQGCT